MATQEIQIKKQVEDIYLREKGLQKQDEELRGGEQETRHKERETSETREVVTIQRLTSVFQNASQPQVLLDFYQMVSIDWVTAWCNPPTYKQCPSALRQFAKY